MSGATKISGELQAGTSGTTDSSAMETEEYYNPEGGEWSQKVDTGQLCRVCANPNEYLIPIFDGEGLEHELSVKIEKHLPIKVTETDALPQQMCYQCASTLIAWHDLVLNCVEADKKLRELQADEDDDDDDKGAEMFESHSMDSDPADEVDQPSTSESQITAKLQVPKKTVLSKDKKPKLKMVLVKGSLAGTSGQKTVAKTQVAKALELAKSKEGGNEDSASERLPQNLGTSGLSSDSSGKSLPQALEQVSDVPNSSGTGSSDSEDQDVVSEQNVHKKVTKKYFGVSRTARSSVGNHTCSLCGRKYMTKKSLREHTRKHFLERVKCTICDRMYKNESMLKIHAERHKGPRKYTCQYCNKEFIFLAHLKYHFRIIHKKKLPETIESKNSSNKKEIPTTSHICHQCGKSFKTTQVLKAHERFVHQLVPKKQICEVCGKMFHLASKLKRHMVQHTGEKPFECEKCGMRFGHKQTLRNHQICHSDLRPFTCKFCGKAFKRERNMRGHEEKNHGLVISRSDYTGRSDQSKLGVTFSCTLCDKEFSLKQRLDAHIAYHKRQFLTFPCSICGKVLTSKHGRDNHIRTHTGERPYVCKICGLALKTQAQLRTHNETHTDTKPFHCAICNKHFRRRPHLETHIRIHTGEKPFACDVCGRCFAQNGDMRKHRLKLHGPLEPKVVVLETEAI